MDTHLKLDEQARIKIAELISSEATKLFIDNIKAASQTDTGTFRMVITTDDVDRVGEIVDIDGWDFSHYMKSPVVLWGHNYALMPVGITDSLTREGNKIIAEGRFAPTEMGQTLRKLYDMGMNRASSVGFMALEQEGNRITKAQLLEWSFVSVPANPYALSLRELSVIQAQEVADLVMKSVFDKFSANIKEGEAVETTETPKEELVVEIPSPSTEAASEMPVEQKGEVQDALTAEQKREAKYQNISKAFEIMYAMCDVYLNEETPVEDFNKLLNEAIALLSNLTGGSVDTKGVVFDILSSTKEEVKTKRNIALENILGTKDEDSSADNSEGDDDESLDDKTPLEQRELLQKAQTIIQDALTALKPFVKKLY